MKDTIKLLINRKWETIPTQNILYITISDKLSFLHLADSVTLNLFITLSELEKELPESDFIRISRSCIVNYRAIASIHNSRVFLLNGETVPYSKRREGSVLDGYQKYRQRCFPSGEDTTKKSSSDLAEQYKVFNHIPFPFAIVEIITDSRGIPRDFVFRYANQALAELERVPLEDLYGNTFHSVFENASAKWLAIYQEVAFEGTQLEVVDFSEEIGKMLRIQCFQPSSGFCACLLTDVTGKEDDASGRSVCPRKFSTADTCQRIMPLVNKLTPRQIDSLEVFLRSMQAAAN